MIGSHATLALDIGGTKMLAALVRDGIVEYETILPTQRGATPDAWLEALKDATRDWPPPVAVGAAVSGLVDEGCWSALNAGTLDVRVGYPLERRLRALWDVPVVALNDAQAAAWGEFRFGAGNGTRSSAGADLVFLTVSTGIGGGIVSGGRLLTGLAGHFGQWRTASDAAPIEDVIAGRGIARAAQDLGRDGDSHLVFEAAGRGEDWAEAIVEGTAARIAHLAATIMLALDPARIVVGGGIGLASGFLDRVRCYLDSTPPRLRPTLVAAKLGIHAGVVGVADLALQHEATYQGDEG